MSGNSRTGTTKVDMAIRMVVLRPLPAGHEEGEEE